MNEMWAVQYGRYGGPEVLTIGQVPMPKASASQVLVEVAAFSVNQADLAARAGKMKGLNGFGFPKGRTDRRRSHHPHHRYQLPTGPSKRRIQGRRRALRRRQTRHQCQGAMNRHSIPVPAILRYSRATAEEIATHSPADELMPKDCDRWVRCITINAPHHVVYRWLCQLTVAPYSFDAIDFPGRRSPRTLTPGAEHLEIGQHFLIFALTNFAPDAHIAGLSRPEFARAYGHIAVSYAAIPLDAHTTRLRANACVAHTARGLGLRHLALAAGDKLMAGRQLRVLKTYAESSQGPSPRD